MLVAARFSAPVQTGPGAHPASCAMGTGSFPGVKSGRGVTLTPHPLLVPYFVRTPDEHFIQIFVLIFLKISGRAAALQPYCPYGPYGLYRASVPVQG